MNPRIFKKLTQRAAKALEAKNYVQHLEKIQQHPMDGDAPEIKRSYRWERKSYIGGKPPKAYYGCGWCVKTMNGTVGFGATSGYYEPEWDDSDALSILIDHVFESFTDWGSFEHPRMGMPENHCPKKLIKNPALAIKYFEQNFRIAER
ncbi:hypothetical protein GL177_19335 [Vibrio toranzoniae]|uniref:hypothetical protein n=1 Tax=Vibrio toranzoniae TaxID=1194427 RepID=UPI001377E755|nr:hypothetical protein [Vibrio toranzoniae]NAZ55468.1 hypothetical protein [Vibrio toranzoniae]